MNVRGSLESWSNVCCIRFSSDLPDIYPEERQRGAEPHATHQKMNNGGRGVQFLHGEPRLGV